MPVEHTGVTGPSWGDSVAWGDTEFAGDDAGPLDMLPLPSDDFDAATGIRTVTEWKFNDKKQKVKVVRKTKKFHSRNKVAKSAILRKKTFTKYGDCAGIAGPEPGITYVSFDMISLEDMRRSQDERDAEANATQDDLIGALSNFALVKAKKARESKESGGKSWLQKMSDKANANAQSETSSSSQGASGAGGKYVPMHMRAGAGPSKYKDADDLPTLRISNLSEEATEDDIKDLLRQFGQVTRLRLAKDRMTGRSRGFAFATFVRRDEAQAALDKLDGFGYDSLILSLEWAESKAPGAGGAAGGGGFRRGPPKGGSNKSVQRSRY